MNSEELTGTIVLIHPELTTDPARKAGQVGVINDYDADLDIVYVGFGRNGQGVYGSDAVLMIRPAAQLRETLEQRKLDMRIDDYKAIFQISLLQELRPSIANIKTAMSLALQSETVRTHSMYSLEDKLGLRRQAAFER